LAFALLSVSFGQAADDDFFAKQVAPILETRCVSCHQGSKPKGKLALTTAKLAMAGGESGRVIEPGKPDESLLIEYISGDKPEMPKDERPLKPEQVAILKQWVRQGAAWPEGLTLTDKKEIDTHWWSLEPLAKISPPASQSTWIRTPIDAFILKQLDDNKLAPSPEADRRTLIRRLSYDLHGLPPTPEEVDAFEADKSADAYEKLVERLLASPRYGERWGRHWLDVVHFGETHGYDKDKVRTNAWPYRDYVINSFNVDKPYPRFIEEQLAGDVLYPQDSQGVVATGFISAGPWDFVGHIELREGTVDKEIARSNDRDDMVATTASTFVSLTVHCARCHNHKFDPIKQTDYYRMQAVFAGVDRADRPYDADPQTARNRLALHTSQRDLEARQKAFEQAAAAASSPKIKELDEQVAGLTKQIAALPVESGKRSSTLGYHSSIMPQQDLTKWVQVDLGQVRSIDEVVLLPSHVAYGGHAGPGFGFPHRFRVEVSDVDTFATTSMLADHTAADFPNPGDAAVRIPGAGAKGRYLRVTATKLWKRTDDWIFALAEMAVMSGKTNVARDAVVTALDSIEANPAWGKKNLVDGYSSLELLQIEGDGQLTHRQQLAAEAEKLKAERNRLLAKALDPKTREQLAATVVTLAEVKKQIAALPPQRVVYAGANEFGPLGSFQPAKKPRPIHLLDRGSVTSPKELMSAGAVGCVPGPDANFALSDPDQEGQRRAALARWLSDPSNVLVRRSIVNRIWHYHFGQGIVDTPNDFGRMGSKPTHPELLEWLSGWFIQNGESFKPLHRLILSSAVYRQASTDKPEFAKIDGGNRLLWRMNRARLDAECVRDAMLFADGKLDLTMGGPSVQQFFFKDDHSPVYDYERFNVEDPKSFRRSVYRFIVRSVPDPFMDSLDCADPSILTPKRNITLTALQALALFNNRFVLHQAEHLAGRVAKSHADVAGQIEEAYRLCLARRPTAKESQQLAAYTAEFGLANACRVILNSNEFLFID